MGWSVSEVGLLYLGDTFSPLEGKLNILSHFFGDLESFDFLALNNIQQIIFRQSGDKFLTGQYLCFFFLEELVVELVLQVNLDFLHVCLLFGLDFLSFGLFLFFC